MTISKMPKPKPPVLTPEQKARAIDALNEQARAQVARTPKVASMPKPGRARVTNPAS